MRELKLALGGMSNRSDRSGNHQFIYNQERNLYEAENVIFSDEGSNDSLNGRQPVPEEESKEENPWMQVKES